MLKLKKIAITGGIASGKTTVCRILKDHGASTLSSDEIIHQLLRENSTCIDKVIALLGSEIMTEGQVDRKKVADIVFNDEKKLKALEALLHPFLLDRIEEEYKKAAQEEKGNDFVVELPLVQEIGKEKNFDLIVAVVSNKERALKRFIQAGFTEDSFHKRNARQWDQEKKARAADYVIENNGTFETLKHKVLEMMKEIHSQ
ncbi:MAG: dephospho-CoA kinase [Chlamydiia bacterium]|nr:dephospho-CoA kinase [Chlamydiia bacterium]